MTRWDYAPSLESYKSDLYTLIATFLSPHTHAREKSLLCKFSSAAQRSVGVCSDNSETTLLVLILQVAGGGLLNK